MSANVKIASGLSARSSVAYALYGRGEQNRQHMEDGTTRAAGYACTMESPEAFIDYAEAQACGHGRKNEVYNLILAFDPKKFDIAKPEDIERAVAIAQQLASAAFSAEHMVVIHDDANGEHVHAHIVVVNHDELTGKALEKNTSWSHGLRQLNDQILSENGLEPNPNPVAPKPDWELRREQFTTGRFEQTLGDRVYESLADPRSANREKFEVVLAEHGVRLKVTDRDGWTYSMRREDNGKWGRKKASALTPEFTAEGAQQIFDYRAQKGASHGVAGHDEDRRRAAADFGDVADVELDARRHRAAVEQADEGRQRPERVREGDGRGAYDQAEGADLAAARVALDLAARRRDAEQAERDREDARRVREDRDRRARREAEQRRVRECIAARRAALDEGDQREAGDDGPELG